jgi:hypothetical protein
MEIKTIEDFYKKYPDIREGVENYPWIEQHYIDFLEDAIKKENEEELEYQIGWMRRRIEKCKEDEESFNEDMGNWVDEILRCSDFNPRWPVCINLEYEPDEIDNTCFIHILTIANKKYEPVEVNGKTWFKNKEELKNAMIKILKDDYKDEIIGLMDDEPSYVGIGCKIARCKSDCIFSRK